VVKVLCFQCRACTGLISGWGTKIFHAAQHSQKIKKSEGGGEREKKKKRKEGTILEKLEMKWYINSKHVKKEIIKSKDKNC